MMPAAALAACAPMSHSQLSPHSIANNTVFCTALLVYVYALATPCSMVHSLWAAAGSCTLGGGATLVNGSTQAGRSKAANPLCAAGARVVAADGAHMFLHPLISAFKSVIRHPQPACVRVSHLVTT